MDGWTTSNTITVALFFAGLALSTFGITYRIGIMTQRFEELSKDFDRHVTEDNTRFGKEDVRDDLMRTRVHEARSDINRVLTEQHVNFDARLRKLEDAELKREAREWREDERDRRRGGAG